MDEKMQKVREAVERELVCSAHSMAHVWRVYRLCLRLAADETNVDTEVLELASLLHDIARVREDTDDTGMTDHAVLGAAMAEPILRDAGYPEATVRHVCSCIATHRFRGDAVPATIEAKLLFDADKIDSLGAVGIARAYMLAAGYGEAIYSDENVADYVACNHVGGVATGRIRVLSEHTPNLEFEIAFKRIPDRLFTPQAHSVAVDRLAVMQTFFDRLKAELDGLA
ncbi:MAG TPA: HD domain-containing protein [Clostridia bacterium]|nr:HD domain-containing protein [Clostridia bacterium]